MPRRLAINASLILTGVTVLGMLLALAAWWPLEGALAERTSMAGLGLVYVAGGLPPSRTACGPLPPQRWMRFGTAGSSGS